MPLPRTAARGDLGGVGGGGSGIVFIPGGYSAGEAAIARVMAGVAASGSMGGGGGGRGPRLDVPPPPAPPTPEDTAASSPSGPSPQTAPPPLPAIPSGFPGLPQGTFPAVGALGTTLPVPAGPLTPGQIDFPRGATAPEPLPRPAPPPPGRPIFREGQIKGRTTSIGKLWKQLTSGRISRRLITQILKELARGVAKWGRILGPTGVGVLGPFIPSPMDPGVLTEEDITNAQRAWDEYIAAGGEVAEDMRPEGDFGEVVTGARERVLERITEEERELDEREAVEAEWERRFGTQESPEEVGVLREIIERMVEQQGQFGEVIRDIVSERQAESEETQRQISETERRILERINQPAVPLPAPQPSPPAAGRQSRARSRLPLYGSLAGAGALALLFGRRGGRTYTTATGSTVRGLTGVEPGGVPLPTIAAFSSGSSQPGACKMPKRRPRGDCLERAPVNWASGRYRGKRAGNKCIRWKR